MEVTVKRMRRNGVKLSPEELASAQDVHGFLEISYWVLNDGHGPARTIKELILKPYPDANCRPLLTLSQPEQMRLRGADMVYVGQEKLGGETHPQAWWCRLDIRPKGNGVRAYD